MSTDRERAEALAAFQTHIDRVYVARADARQKALGLAYVEAERQDLAREMLRAVKAAGWLPRPEPGSAEEDAMVERAARALAKFDPQLGWRYYAPEARAALRAALGTGAA